MLDSLRLSGWSRLSAAVIASAGIASLLLAAWCDHVRSEGANSAFDTVWHMARFFTNLTNLLVAVAFMDAAVRGRWRTGGLVTAMTLWLSVVGSVYYLLLAKDHNPQGALFVTSLLHHAIIPVAVFLFWLTAAPRLPITFRQPLLWALWPLTYGIYSLARGLATGLYPYFFFDPRKIGWSGMAFSLIGFTGLFLVLGLIFRLTSNRVRRPLDIVAVTHPTIEIES